MLTNRGDARSCKVPSRGAIELRCGPEQALSEEVFGNFPISKKGFSLYFPYPKFGFQKPRNGSPFPSHPGMSRFYRGVGEGFGLGSIS